MKKRLFSLFLAFIMAVSILPAPVSGQDVDHEASATAGELEVDTSNGFGALLGAQIESMEDTQSQGAAGGSTVTDLIIEGSTATVTLDSLQEAVLIVALYSEDGMQLIQSVTTSIVPEQRQASVTFPEEMPAYFRASAYLVDPADYAPLSAHFETSLYTKVMQDLLRSTVDDYDPDRVLNLDNDRTTNFVVYAENTVHIESTQGVNTVTSCDHDNRIYVIDNADEQFTGLTAGDVVSYQYAENDWLIVKVAEIQTEGTTVTLTGGELEINEVFDKVKLEGTADTSTAKVEDLDPDDGIDLVGTSENPPVLYASDDEMEFKDKLTYTIAEKKIKSPSGNNYITASGSLDFAVEGGFSYYYTDDFTHFRAKATYSIGLTLNISGAITVPLHDFTKITLGPIPFAGFSFEPKIDFSVSGTINQTWVITGDVGTNYNTDTGFINLCTRPRCERKPKLQIVVYIAIDLHPEAFLISDNLVEASLSVPMGITFSASMKGTKYGEILTGKDIPKLHECAECLDGYLDIGLHATAKIKFCDNDKWSNSTTFVFKILNYPFYYSFDYDEWGEGVCPHNQYLVIFEVVDPGNYIAQGAKIYVEDLVLTTDENGVVRTHLHNGTHKVTCKYEDMTYTATVTIRKEAQKHMIYLKAPEEPEEPVFADILDDTQIGNVTDNSAIVVTQNWGTRKWTLYTNGLLSFEGSTASDTLNGTANYLVPWYDYRSMIKTVYLPDCITEIGDYAFRDCSNLTYIEGLEHVAVVGDYAFTGCSKLTFDELTNLQEFGAGAFQGCKSLSAITVPEEMTEIPERAFEQCSGLTSIFIPDNVKTIDKLAFSWCKGLTAVTGMKNVESISQQAFDYCSVLSEIALCNNLKEIADHAFNCCNALTEVIIPDSVTTLASRAFYEAKGLKKVVIGSGVTVINSQTFKGCNLLESAVIKGNVTSIKEDAFSGCQVLKEVQIPATVTEICDNAFKSCYALKEIRIPAAVTKVGGSAFYSCEDMTKVVFEGDAPEFGNRNVFYKVYASMYYPAGNPTWTEELMRLIGNTKMTWIPYTLDASGNIVAQEALTLACADSYEKVHEDLPEVSESETEPETVEAVHGGKYSTSQTDGKTVKTASFSNLMPGEVYLLLALARVDVIDPLSADNLLYVDQAEAGEDGTLSFTYIQRTEKEPSYVVACGAATKDLKNATVTVPDMYADGNVHAVSAKVTYSGKTLKEGRDYILTGQVSYTDPGNYVFYIDGVHNYKGTLQCSYQVTQKTQCADGHTEQTISGKNPTCTEDGLTDGVTCSECGAVIKEQTTIQKTGHSWSDATCTQPEICRTCRTTRGNALDHDFEDGICNICDSKDPNYEKGEPALTLSGLFRLYGENRIQTAFKIADTLKSSLSVEKFRRIIVASALNFPDALTGSYLAAEKNAPILLTYSKADAQVTEYIRENLQSGGTVYILGGTNAVSQEFENGLTVLGIKVKRLAGDNRFGTNMAILAEAGVRKDQEILICTATGFADSLSASAAGLPILLVHKTLNQEQKAFLAGSSGKFVIIGGEAAVSASVETELKAYGTVERVGGANRYETSVKVAQRFVPDAKTILLAYAKNYPDGLCGGPLAVSLNASLILTDNKGYAVADDYAQIIRGAVVIGGPGLISDDTVREIFDAYPHISIPVM